MNFLDTDKIKTEWETDATIQRVKTATVSGARKFPSAAARYALDKIPIVSWLPYYNPRWGLPDFIAGLTVGVMMVPQALAYAKIATIDGQFGLYSSWLPAAIYVIMGTSKDLSIGPTSILGLLTAEVIRDLKTEGFAAQDIASAIAFMVGLYSLALGLLKLGFVLDYISIPVLSGFLSAAAITIALGQVGSLVGLSNVPSGTAAILNDVFSRIEQFKPLTCAIGFGGIALLYALEIIGRKWGRVHPAIKFLASSRAVIVLIAFTGLSYGVNNDRASTPLWDISKVSANGLIAPEPPGTELLLKVAGRSIAPLIAATLEHLAIGRAFGRKGGYMLDTSQELCYLGLTNVVNSLFGAMAVGGAMSRTAVNYECGVRSPLSGLFTAGFILLTLYKLAGALFWIPKATLSAIIIMAVIHVIGPVSIFYRFWRTSLADFTAAMLCFWMTLFVSTETGIEIAVAFSVAYTLVRSAFATAAVRCPGSTASPRVGELSKSQRSSSSTSSYNISYPVLQVPGHVTFWQKTFPVPQRVEKMDDRARNPGNMVQKSQDVIIPPGTLLVQFSDAVFFPNATRVTSSILESVKIQFDPATTSSRTRNNTADQAWNAVAAQKRVRTLRARLLQDEGKAVSVIPLAVVIWDFSRVPFIDFTGVAALKEMMDEIRAYMGWEVEVRVVGLSERLEKRFERAGWVMARDEDVRMRATGEKIDAVVFESLAEAVWDREVWEDEVWEKRGW